MPELLLAREIAQILDISTPHVYRLSREGVLPAHRLGSAWRFVLDEVLDALGISTDEDGNPDVARARDVGDILGITEQHVGQLALAGRLPCFRLRGSVRFDLLRLEAEGLIKRVASEPEPSEEQTQHEPEEENVIDLFLDEDEAEGETYSTVPQMLVSVAADGTVTWAVRPLHLLTA